MDPHSFFADPDPVVFLNADPDPGDKMNADPCGSGSTFRATPEPEPIILLVGAGSRSRIF